MSRYRPARPFVLMLLASTLLGALFLALPRMGSDAAAEEVLVAHSICEAQNLKARKAESPHLAIEIPPEFDKKFPSLSACRAHEAAWDEDAEGPLQPIPFSHAHHAGEFEISCLYCHSGTDRSQAAGVPSVEICMGCHLQFGEAFDELEGIRILKQHWEDKTPIEWQQIHRLPEHVQFRHNRHVKAGIECQDCHGPVAATDKLYLVPDTKWWPWLLPTQKLEMGWCIMCHREKEASTDCLTCHY